MARDYDALQLAIFEFIQSCQPDGFEELILEVHAFQRERNQAYGRFCEGMPEPKTWKQIPAVSQSVFKQADLISFPGPSNHLFHTSGTTGIGHGRHHFSSLHLYESAAKYGWYLAGLPEVDHVLMESPAEAPHSSLSRMAGWLAPQGTFYIRHHQPYWAELAAQLLNPGRPVCLFGTALAYLDFFGWIADNGFRVQLPEGSVAVETGGYKGSRREITKEHFLGYFAHRLGLRPEQIVNEYGMTELSSQFYARGEAEPHLCPPWARAVVMDPTTGQEVPDGQSGVLKLFDLANLGSVCAVLTQDIAVRRGDDFALVGRDPRALPRGCSRSADEKLSQAGASEARY